MQTQCPICCRNMWNDVVDVSKNQVDTEAASNSVGKVIGHCQSLLTFLEANEKDDVAVRMGLDMAVGMIDKCSSASSLISLLRESAGSEREAEKTSLEDAVEALRIFISQRGWGDSPDFKEFLDKLFLKDGTSDLCYSPPEKVQLIQSVIEGGIGSGPRKAIYCPSPRPADKTPSSVVREAVQ